MNPLNTTPPDQDKVVDARQKQQETQYQKIGQYRPHPGHKMYEYNRTTGALELAKLERVDLNYTEVINGSTAAKYKVVVSKNCIYIPALNEKNAKRKLAKKYGIKFNP